MVFSVMKLSLWVNLKVKQITSHYCFLWASNLSHFSSFEQVTIEIFKYHLN